MKNGFLDDIAIAEPCSASWDDMSGDERVRFCSDCKLNVYNFSAMSRTEAEELVRTAEGRLCGRFFRRADGTVLTQDCPVGLRRAVRWAWARTAALAGLFWGGLLGCTDRKTDDIDRPDQTTPAVAPPALMGEVHVPEPEALLGRICPVPKVDEKKQR